MNLKHFFSGIALLLTIAFISCDKSPEIQEQKRLDATDELGFIAGSNNNYYDAPQLKDQGGVTIVTIKLWRKKYNCLRGLGICRVTFFAPNNQEDNDISFDSDREVSIGIPDDFTGGDLNVYFSEDVSSYTLDELKLYIDEDIVGDNSSDFFNDVFEIPQVIYNYDSSLGEYGGYTIQLQAQ